MKKIMLGCLLTFLFFGVSQITLNSQERRERPQFQREGGLFGEGFEIRQKMREIEKQTIENDPELKKLDEQIKSLQKQFTEKLQQKLKDNAEYQELKQKLERLQQQWRERRRERQQEED
ncbi:MAG: hypothetical protein NC926_00460 [Candidatus Omnitrophica bacterium]|nr:hypothetical protein [Candidatus Omnitrophota bacterium]MCM8806422.1 hypothetical protein [Candidatus Omnitrophota bacterium]